ncbi:hypothetical protein R6Q59_020864 [Mikania micrantha]
MSSLKTHAVVATDLRQPPQSTIAFLASHRPWSRKRRSFLVIRSSSKHHFLPQLNLLTPALAFTTALDLFHKFNSTFHQIGDWTLITSPTPFNRFIKLRCASLQLKELNEKLIEEDGRVVSIDTGRIPQIRVNLGKQVLYQRICVNTDDGGVVSLDWPADLELSLEYGLDTTVLIVPGTTEGSMDENVRSFVSECLTRGCFPIVMNPRGCAHSPLTTPRLFTAADSDDICTTVQFIKRARPWTTFMAVGFGYGANMLTKYLAEAGEETPLTAAMCLDIPFDLEVASDHLYFDQNLTSGLIDMLQSNKELFLGRSKGFDVEKALQAKSLKDFEEAISMVSYGFDSIEQFYASSSVGNAVGDVKIPLLFIQNNAMPSFSILHSLIAENPFTSLLICSFQSDNKRTIRTFDVPWCQHLLVEWLTFVELGLLKGRHPLLEDNDVTISPTKQMASHASSRINNLLNLHQLDGNISHPWKKMLKRSDEYANSSSGFDLQMSKAIYKDTTNGMVTRTNLVDLKERDMDSERGEVVQATEVVMNMLDVTMPEALSEEQKLKVLTAVGQGETLMNALQDAVPEEVRGKLISSVTAILENQKKNFNELSRVPGTSAINMKKQERSKGISSVEEDMNASKLNASLPEEATNNHPYSKNDTSKPTEAHTLGNSDDDNQLRTLGNSDDDNQLQSTNNQGGELSHSGNASSHDQLGSDDFPKENAAQLHDSASSVTPDISKKMDRSEDHVRDQINQGLEGGTNVEKDNQHKDASEYSTDISTPPRTEKTPISSTDVAKEVGENQKKEESSAQPFPSSHSPSFSVSQALDALTGLDDSTQAAVNSVFSVIEDVITQLEEKRDNGSAVDNDNTSIDSDSQSAATPPSQKEGDEKSSMTTEHKEVGNGTEVDNDNNTSIDSDSKSAATPLSQKGGDEKSSMTTEHKEVGNHQQTMSISTERKNEANKNPDDVQHSITKLPYRNSLYDHYVQSHLYSMRKNEKLLQPDAATALYLDYVPEEGQWKLLEQSGDRTSYVGDIPSDVQCDNDIIEPTYVILDAEGEWDSVGEPKKIYQPKEILETGNVRPVQLLQFVKANILKSLEPEVSRRMQATDMTKIALVLKEELENVANTISLAVVHDKQHAISCDGENLVGLGNLHDDHLLDAISSAVQGTRYMKEVIPVGIVVGSSLASLRKIMNTNTADSVESSVTDQISVSERGCLLKSDRMTDDEIHLDEINQNNLCSEDEEKNVSSSLSSDTVMVGAVTAALGASALLIHKQNSCSDGLESSTTSCTSLNQKENDVNSQGLGKLEEETSKSDENIITSLAEKAMLVAGPVVPTKEDGGVDQERLVSLLADLGQKGGILKLVGKVALLWGGIRGAMSLTGKLISFLRLAERSLFQRIVGFVFMVLVLWTPVVIPLLPTLVQNWAAHNSSKYAELACIIGLYSSIMILVVLWGKKIRGYEDPLERYGLELTSARQIQHFACGLIGGLMFVLLIQYTHMLLGFVSISWPTLPSSTDAVTLLKLFGKVLRFVGQGLVTAIAVALVEELLFRSWLSEEIAVDLGYHQGIILSGLAFSLSQWSLKAIPGVWLLSVGLAGVKQRCQGKLSLPIGLRAGIMATSFFLKEGGFLIYQQHNNTTYPLWVSGSGDHFQPFNSIVGLAVAFLWATILYPRNSQNTLKEKIKE